MVTVMFELHTKWQTRCKSDLWDIIAAPTSMFICTDAHIHSSCAFVFKQSTFSAVTKEILFTHYHVLSASFLHLLNILLLFSFLLLFLHVILDLIFSFPFWFSFKHSPKELDYGNYSDSPKLNITGNQCNRIS